MTRKTDSFTAALGASLLMITGHAAAEPVENCQFDQQQGYSYEQVGTRTGWHLWECRNGNWHYVAFCGRGFC